MTGNVYIDIYVKKVINMSHNFYCDIKSVKIYIQIVCT
jgi:hypothetical protein